LDNLRQHVIFLFDLLFQAKYIFVLIIFPILNNLLHHLFLLLKHIHDISLLLSRLLKQLLVHRLHAWVLSVSPVLEFLSGLLWLLKSGVRPDVTRWRIIAAIFNRANPGKIGIFRLLLLPL
jgi:hypothetical protein